MHTRETRKCCKAALLALYEVGRERRWVVGFRIGAYFSVSSLRLGDLGVVKAPY